MPLSIITKPAFPNVPDVSGVPVIKRSNRTSPVVRVMLGRIQNEIWRALNTQHQWGIFDQNGKALVIADTVLEISYKDSARISQYPIAEGSFANYNKVSNPKEITIRLCKGGGLSTSGEVVNIFKNGLGNVGKAALNARSHFLDKIEQLKQSFELINIVTPEKTYISYSVSDYSFRREKSNGAYMILVDLNLIEVRNVKAQYSKTEQVSTQHAQSPDAQQIQNNGKVQTDTVTDPQPVRSAVQSFIGA